VVFQAELLEESHPAMGAEEGLRRRPRHRRINSSAKEGISMSLRMRRRSPRLQPALDLGTLVTTKLKGERKPVFLARAQKGVFEAHYHQKYYLARRRVVRREQLHRRQDARRA
jgi:hypothetical protein